ncbi:MAG: AAA family ATPase [Saprospiraceae bacterium]|nr:AAA family ATPase [Saprospiraceae bacterium]
MAITNLKGGVGKSTICQNLAAYLVHQNHKTCIVDTDVEQQTSMKWSGHRESDVPSIPVFTISDEKALAKNVQALEATYDFILIDGTPILSTLATRTILISDLVIIPILPSGADIWSLEKFIERLHDAIQVRGDHIPAYVLINKFNSTEKRTVGLDKEVLEVLKQLGLSTLESTLNYRVAFREAMIEGLTAYEYRDPKAKMEIENLGIEILSIIQQFLPKSITT